ncbi:MAG: asparagine synthase (glutamine-hydrolyzing) [Candidatus Latescibacteria bacterium]|nr:asparagine synthase (glutamine-hydrolyzing) [Candidatus Latescibacterota bacterium]
MCGIAGILDPHGVAEADVRKMADALAHRGPDDATVHVESGLGLGFRRLAIIDLVTGRQPVPNEDGSVLVILNGEIYNYRSLRAGLIERGHRFHTQTDTEVLVHLYEERGSELLRELRGMFAFALWDRPHRTLLIARDHLGQKPLYWAQRGDRFYFASEIKAILAAAPELRQLDPLALDEYLTLRVIAEPRSMFAAIRKLPPAHFLEIAEGRRTERRYWGLRYEPKRTISERDALAEVDSALVDAVRDHLVSDVPVGAFLSGGIDSGLVVAAIRRVTDAPFKTFSVSVPYGSFDEGPAARAVAERYRTEHHDDAIDGNLVRLLPRLVYHLDEPSDPLSACLYHLAEFARQHVKVALGGDGGDELFGGYDRYYANRYARYYALLPRGLRRHVFRRLLDLAPDGFWYKSLSHQLRWLDEVAREEGGRRYARSLSYFYFTPELRRTLYTSRLSTLVESFDAEESVIRWHDDAGIKDALDRMLLADTMVRLPNHSVMILDRMTMAHGLEARSPFLDHRFAELIATLPSRLKVRGRTRRYLEMKLAARYLPQEVLRRPKQGFSSALPYLMGSQFRALFGRYLPTAHLVEGGYLRREAIEWMLEGHLGGRSDHGNRLWLLLNAEIWHRIHIEGADVAGLEEEIAALLGVGSQPAAANSRMPVTTSS